MSYSIGTGENGRDIGYGVPAECDHPKCKGKIDRGMDYLCEGCGLYFCGSHMDYSEKREMQVCGRCKRGNPAYEPKPDVAEWVNHKLTDESWQQWRDENPEEVKRMQELFK